MGAQAVDRAVVPPRVAAPAVVAAVAAAWALDVLAFTVRANAGHPYVLASLFVAIAIAGLFVLVCRRRAAIGLLGLVGLVAFNALFVFEASQGTSLQPLGPAALAVFVAGVVLVRFHRATWPDLIAGLVLFYVTVGVLFESSAWL